MAGNSPESVVTCRLCELQMPFKELSRHRKQEHPNAVASSIRKGKAAKRVENQPAEYEDATGEDLAPPALPDPPPAPTDQDPPEAPKSSRTSGRGRRNSSSTTQRDRLPGGGDERVPAYELGFDVPRVRIDPLVHLHYRWWVRSGYPHNFAKYIYECSEFATQVMGLSANPEDEEDEAYDGVTAGELDHSDDWGEEAEEDADAARTPNT